MENITITSNNKEEIYKEILPQIKCITEGETDIIANLANISAIIKEAFGFWWVGFYIVKDDQLVLGPFQGPLACTRIGLGKGVCGTSWKEKKTLVVANLDELPEWKITAESEEQTYFDLVYVFYRYERK